MLNAIFTSNSDTFSMPKENTIGKRIRKARGKRTLATISKGTRNLSVSRISNYEHGTRKPGIEEAVQLAQALGNISAAEILGIDEESNLTPQERALLDNFRAADERGKKTIIGVAESQPAYMLDKKAG